MNRFGTPRREQPAIQRYVSDAVPFVPSPSDGCPPSPIRVARTLMTCATAVAILNDIGVPAEPGSAYRHLNVHNPRCPLRFDDPTWRWTCQPGFEDHPAWGFNWAGARLLCEHLGARLPTAREWEGFASNNDPDRIYPWGDDEPTQHLANFGEHIGGTSVAGRFPPSELGLYDLAGNLGEWCQDRHPCPGLPESDSKERTVKGGAWSKDAHHLSIRAGRGKWERLGTTTIGIRPVWDT